MARVVVYVDKTTGERETLDSMMRRFKKQVMNDGILYETKRREYFVPKPLKRKLKSLEAKKRAQTRKTKNLKNRQKSKR